MRGIFGSTEQNVQPEPPARKPNEDHFGWADLGEGRTLALVMDGIPVPRNDDDSYPIANGSIASQLAVATMTECARQFAQHPIAAAEPMAVLTGWFTEVNRAIGRKNKELGLLGRPESWRLGTVGCACWLDEHQGIGWFASIGDPFTIVQAPTDDLLFFGRDQLQGFHQHLLTRHGADNQRLGEMEIRTHQDRYVRNCVEAKCFCNQSVPGWGALTGEETALRFLELQKTELPPGSRVILASDAIEVFGQGKGSERNPQDFRTALDELRPYPAEEATNRLIRLIRAEETARQKKSDDATVVIIDI